MRTELIKHINWRITRSMQNPFHMARYGTKLRSVGFPVHAFIMNEPQDNQTIQNKFHVWEDTETFQNLTKSPLPTHPLVLPQCHRLPSSHPLLDLSMEYLPMLALLLLYCNWISVNKWTWTWIKNPTNICHKDVQTKPNGSILIKPDKYGIHVVKTLKAP